MTGNLLGMFLQFFTSLREAQVPVTLREYLTLMEALDADLAEQSVDNFAREPARDRADDECCNNSHDERPPGQP